MIDYSGQIIESNCSVTTKHVGLFTFSTGCGSVCLFDDSQKQLVKNVFNV